MATTPDFTLTKIENESDKAVLTSKTQMVNFPLSETARHCIQQLKSAFDTLKGVGLAAPQIGIDLSIFIIGISEQAAAVRENATTLAPTIYLNPHYEPIDQTLFHDFEGCFSVDSKCGWVPRYKKIRFRACTENGDPINNEIEGFTARVLQHETDHLYGTLIIDRLTADCRQGTLDEMLAYRIASLSKEKREILWESLPDSVKATLTKSNHDT